MSNHGYVKTEKSMSQEKVTKLLNDLNETHFKGNLKIELCEPPNIDEDKLVFWELTYVGNDGKQYGMRQCWLNTQKSFEIRYCGPAGDFIWWVGSVITNEIAVQFNGIITDDGFNEEVKGESPCELPHPKGWGFLAQRPNLRYYY